MLSFSEILSFVVLAQFLLIIIFLFTNNKGRRLSNILLGLFFTSLALGFLDATLILFGIINDPDLALFLNGFVILHPPLLLLYTYSITRKKFKLRPRHLLHAIPFIVVSILLIIYYHTQGESTKEEILHQVSAGNSALGTYITVGGLLYELAYLIPVKGEIYRFQRKMRDHFSNVDKMGLNWLNFLVNIFIISFVLSTIGSFFRQVEFAYLEEFGMLLAVIGLFLFINVVLLKGLYQNEIFTLASPDSKDIPAPDRAHPIIRDLKSHMDSEKPYLDPFLTVEELADQTGVDPRELSLVLNQYIHQNFFDFVNRYRIEEAKRLLKSPASENRTILKIMYDCGFNSKSSFNTAFKKYTGLTPSRFKKLNQ